MGKKTRQNCGLKCMHTTTGFRNSIPIIKRQRRGATLTSMRVKSAGAIEKNSVSSPRRYQETRNTDQLKKVEVPPLPLVSSAEETDRPFPPHSSCRHRWKEKPRVSGIWARMVRLPWCNCVVPSNPLRSSSEAKSRQNSTRTDVKTHESRRPGGDCGKARHRKDTVRG